MSQFAVLSDGQPADLALKVEALRGELPLPGAVRFESGGVWRLYDFEGGYRIDCQSDAFGVAPYKSALVDRDFRQGRLLIRPEVFGPAMNALDYPLDEVLVAHLLAGGRGAEFHGCGLVDRGKGYLFVGQSGAGKTTSARLWMGNGADTILSDDRVIVRRAETGFQMEGTPWHGEADICSASGAALNGVFLLRQAARTEIREISNAEAVARLFSCSFPPFYCEELTTFIVRFLTDIVEAGLVRELAFTPDSTLIQAVREWA